MWIKCIIIPRYIVNPKWNLMITISMVHSLPLLRIAYLCCNHTWIAHTKLDRFFAASSSYQNLFFIIITWPFSSTRNRFPLEILLIHVALALGTTLSSWAKLAGTEGGASSLSSSYQGSLDCWYLMILSFGSVRG